MGLGEIHSAQGQDTVGVEPAFTGGSAVCTVDINLGVAHIQHGGAIRRQSRGGQQCQAQCQCAENTEQSSFHISRSSSKISPGMGAHTGQRPCPLSLNFATLLYHNRKRRRHHPFCPENGWCPENRLRNPGIAASAVSQFVDKWSIAVPRGRAGAISGRWEKSSRNSALLKLSGGV